MKATDSIWWIAFLVGMFGGFFLCLLMTKCSDSLEQTKVLDRGFINIQGTDYKLVPADVKTVLVEKE